MISEPIAVVLEELSSDDFDRVRSWMDPRIFRIFHAPVDDDQLRVLLTAHEGGKPKSLGYRIVRASDTELLGLIHATIDWKNMLAHIGQIVVDPELKSKGIGEAALRSFLRICFGDLGLHRAQLFVDEENHEAIACYKKVGFKAEGLMREATRVGSDYVSWYSMSILEDEWRERERER